ncbi:UDP-glucose 4-epimerase GalE [Halobacillus amylolyticus]|uniref:UDP-glucose 4-epimerase n=1 Tax=Halobacillus amylolyticus TaxID=2932259 RepID=A0ABY4HGC8_9BACI|nr:UDP-glucose 4-epimerase GalE [Halobacillus amylolyticus]UOR13799.1 UDP-glucose 4-epimerase GalE [Halobacillus amylolyticus]
MTILVTGGAGYIGSHTCVELLNEGYEIVVVDNFSNSSPESLKRVSEITGRTFKSYDVDLLNKKDLDTVFFENHIEAVIHFAGLKAVGESVAEPLWYYKNNVIGTVNLCEIMEKYQVKNLVFSSSATVYGAANVPIPEDAKLAAANPYGRTKHIIEEVLLDLHHSDPEWSIAILRYFNPIGAHQSGHIGEDPTGVPNNLLPYISQVAAGKLERLNVFGNDYPTKDGTGVRDYIHVVDLAAGHLRALQKVQSSSSICTYNLGTGKGYSVIDMVEAFEKSSGQTIPYSILERRPGDVPICFADVSKARDELGWTAKRGIEKMCEDTWRWQQNNPNGYEETSSIPDGTRTPVLSQAKAFFMPLSEG